MKSYSIESPDGIVEIEILKDSIIRKMVDLEGIEPSDYFADLARISRYPIDKAHLVTPIRAATPT